MSQASNARLVKRKSIFEEGASRILWRDVRLSAFGKAAALDRRFAGEKTALAFLVASDFGLMPRRRTNQSSGAHEGK
jgi:hypothetical protein